MKRAIAWVIAAAMSGTMPLGALAAETFPDKPIHLIVA